MFYRHSACLWEIYKSKQFSFLYVCTSEPGKITIWGKLQGNFGLRKWTECFRNTSIYQKSLHGDADPRFFSDFKHIYTNWRNFIELIAGLHSVTTGSLQNNLLYSQRMSNGWPFWSLQLLYKVYAKNLKEFLPEVKEHLPGKPTLHILNLNIREILSKAL